jgi:Domain of unknown function (DUF4912)
MAEESANDVERRTNGPQGYRISNGPIVRLARTESKLPAEFADSVELPRVYGAPFLFTIARDPRTLFVYWNVDWSAIFENTAPVDRQVHLRVYRADGTEEKAEAIEPMAGNCYITVSQPRGDYRVEIGYYQPSEVWHSVANSEQVAMPAEQVRDRDDVDLATIPFHLSYHRLIDLFHAAKPEALTELVSRLQQRAASEEDRALLSDEDWEILRSMNLSVDEIVAARRAFRDREKTAALRKRAETLLGLSGTSPSRGFSESSWS